MPVREVSVATGVCPASKVGPFHFTGYTPLSFQLVTWLRCASSNVISAVAPAPLPAIFDSHAITVGGRSPS